MYHLSFIKKHGKKKKEKHKTVRSTGALVAACVYRSCQYHNADLPHQTLLETCQLKFQERHFWRWIKFIKRNVKTIPAVNKDSQSIIRRWVDEWAKPFRLGRLAILIFEDVTKVTCALEGKRPSTVRAACMKLAAQLRGDNLTAEELHEMSNKTESTINSAYQILLKHEARYRAMMKQ